MAHAPQNINAEIEVPKTITPWRKILFGNGSLLFVSWVIWSLILFPFLNWGWLWAILITIATLGVMIALGSIAVDINDWWGAIAFNRFTKSRRVIFAGFHLKLAWEDIENPMQSLKREITERKIVPMSTNDPTETMEADLLVHMRLDTTGNPAQDAENVIRFASVDDHALKDIVFGEISKMFAKHYATNEMEDLLDVGKIQEKVLADDPQNPANHKKMTELAKKYGSHIEVILNSSKADERTKKLKETPARAEGLSTAIKTLKETGLSPEEARDAALLLDDTAEYSEHRLGLDIKAPDLKNLRDVNIMPGMFDAKGGKKK